MERHLTKCAEARRIGDWKGILRENDVTIVAGAESSPHVYACLFRRGKCILLNYLVYARIF